MSVRKEMPHKDGIYFITFTCCQWLPLFELTSLYDEIYKQFDILKAAGHFIVGFVIMPNHLHALIAFHGREKSVHQRIGTMKRFLAYEIVSRLENARDTGTLATLANAVNNTDKKKGKIHQVFEPSFDCKECWSEYIIRQKLDYMHRNPNNGRWSLSVSLDAYLHSSAKYYLCGEHAGYPVTNYMLLKDIDLTR
jgi:REP element-mobilizing transposase RayT